MESLTIKRLRTKAVFKIVFIGLFCSFIPFFIIMGIFASQGLIRMSWGGVPVTGFKAILMGPFFGIFAAVIIGLLVSIFISLGLMLYAKRKPLELEYYQVSKVGTGKNSDN